MFVIVIDPTNSSQSDTLQVKSLILVKQVGGAVSPFVFMNQVKVLVRMHLNSRTFILS